MNRYYRVVVCLWLAVAVAYMVHAFLVVGRLANDFQWPYSAARELRAGRNPYVGLLPGVPRDFFTGTDPLFYPLPAVLLALPFSFLAPVLAGTVFCSLSAFLLAWALTSTGEYWRLMVFLSAPATVAFGNVQWSPLLLASVYLWWLSPLQVCKPSIGVAAFAAAPRRVAVIGAAFLCALSLVVLPGWPLGWLRNLSRIHHPVPLLSVLPGVFLLSWLTVGRREGRFFAVWSLVPQMVFFYDALLLWLIPQTWRQMLLLTALSWVALFSWHPYSSPSSVTLEWYLIALPAMLVVFWQQRAGAWVLLVRRVVWLRG